LLASGFFEKNVVVGFIIERWVDCDSNEVIGRIIIMNSSSRLDQDIILAWYKLLNIKEIMVLGTIEQVVIVLIM